MHLGVFMNACIAHIAHNLSSSTMLAQAIPPRRHRRIEKTLSMVGVTRLSGINIFVAKNKGDYFGEQHLFVL